MHSFHFPRGTEQYFLLKASPFSFVILSYLTTVETLNIAGNQVPICILIILSVFFLKFSAKVRVQIGLFSYCNIFCSTFCCFWIHTITDTLLWYFLSCFGVGFFFVCFVSLIEITDTRGKKTKIKPTPKLSNHARTKSFSLEELTDPELRISYAISELLLTAILFISQLKYLSSFCLNTSG